MRTIPGTNSNKANERIVVIEPANINDFDLVKYNTSLRLILDKKNGIYQLQVSDMLSMACCMYCIKSI